MRKNLIYWTVIKKLRCIQTQKEISHTITYLKCLFKVRYIKNLHTSYLPHLQYTKCFSKLKRTWFTTHHNFYHVSFLKGLKGIWFCDVICGSLLICHWCCWFQLSWPSQPTSRRCPTSPSFARSSWSLPSRSLETAKRLIVKIWYTRPV